MNDEKKNSANKANPHKPPLGFDVSEVERGWGLQIKPDIGSEILSFELNFLCVCK